MRECRRRIVLFCTLSCCIVLVGYCTVLCCVSGGPETAGEGEAGQG